MSTVAKTRTRHAKARGINAGRGSERSLSSVAADRTPFVITAPRAEPSTRGAKRWTGGRRQAHKAH